jgi:hypothetical protein
VDRVPAIGRTLAIPSATIDRRKLPTSGETVLLVYAESAGEDILVTTANGLSLRLAGLGWLGSELKAGDTLSVRVLATQPTLELEFAPALRDARAAAADRGTTPHDSMNQHAAMRLDQAELRTISWRPPDPAVLGAAWRTLAQERWQQVPSQIDPWTAPVYAWGGISILLRLIEVDEDPPVPRAPRRRRGMALRLDLMHPVLGHIVIQLQGSAHGVRLSFIVEDEASVEPVRERLPAVGAALAHAHFRLAHVSVTCGEVRPAALPEQRVVAQALSPGLFRSAAEIVVAVIRGNR